VVQKKHCNGYPVFSICYCVEAPLREELEVGQLLMQVFVRSGLVFLPKSGGLVCQDSDGEIPEAHCLGLGGQQLVARLPHGAST
jgi:hypothetical protein